MRSPCHNMNRNSSCGNSYHFKRALCIISMQRFWQRLLLWDFVKLSAKMHNGLTDCFCRSPHFDPNSVRHLSDCWILFFTVNAEEILKYSYMIDCMFVTCRELREQHEITALLAHRALCIAPLVRGELSQNYQRKALHCALRPTNSGYRLSSGGRNGLWRWLE